MKPNDENVEEILGKVLHSTPAQEMQAAAGRVLQRLRAEGDRSTQDASVQRSSRRRIWTLSLAAALVLTIIAAVAMMQKRPTSLVETGGTSVVFGDIFRADGDVSTIFMLADGSRVEMRPQSELVVERAADGTRIHLNNGGIIVNAAKQRAGHLYVQTRDVTVSVVGTVFLVNAEPEGSRVAVIEGEVRIEQGPTTKKLFPGQQVATNPLMESRPIREEISWSRHAEEHMALLQQQAARPSRPEFAAVSIKVAAPLPSGPVYADTLKGRTLGVGCHGADGLPRLNFGGGPIQVPQGRCVADWVTVANLMNFAYESPWRYGPGVPDWARHNDDERSNEEHFQIDAAADDPSTATTAQLRQMLQTMLADRFRLKIHRETQEVQRYVIRVAKNSPNLKQASGEVEPPRFGPGIQGKSSLDELAQFLTQFVISFANLGYLDAPIVNRTGLTGIYEYQFRLSRSAAGAGPRGADPGGGGPPSRSARLADTLVAISDGMENQIGLRLEPEKISAEVIVIDQIEKPSPN